jgi:hypothetical protein
MAGRLLVDEKRCCSLPFEGEEGLLETQEVHFCQVLLLQDQADESFLSVVDLQLLPVGGMRRISVVSRRQLLQDILAPTPQQDRPEAFPQLIRFL